MKKRLREDFRVALQTNDYVELASLIKNATVKEINYLKKYLNEHLNEELFYNLIIELINQNLLAFVFSELEFKKYFDKYRNYILTNANYYLTKIIDVYPNLIIYLAKESTISFVLKTFEHADRIYEIIDMLGKYYGYDEIIKNLNNHRTQIDKSTALITYVCKYLASNPIYINDRVTEEISDINNACLSKIQVIKFLELLSKVNIDYNFYKFFRFYCEHPEICEFILSDSICVENSELERKIISVATDVKWFGLLVKILPKERFCDELKQIFETAFEVLNETNKINTFSHNPNFSYDLFKYVYPHLGKKHVISLLKYKSKGFDIILYLCEKGNYEEVKKTLSIWEKLDLLPDEPESIHYLFNHIDEWNKLKDDIIAHNYELSEEAKKHLITIIKNGNLFLIDTVEKLENLNENIITLTPRIYGYRNFRDLEHDIEVYNLNDPIFLRKIYELVKFRKDLLFTPEEYEVINIVNSQNDRQRILLERYNKGKSLVFIEELQSIFAKMRKIYAVAMKNTLSKIDNFSNALRKEIDGIKIIYPQTESFKFLIHTLKGLDSTFSAYPDLIKINPSYWTKLEGSTTLSVCSISDYYMKNLTKTDGKDLSYLFTNIGEDDLLYMGYKDIYVTEGGHQLEPAAKYLKFLDLDALNHYSSSLNVDYNEVALKRQGLMPNAIASFTKEPTCEEMRAAKHFNVPIISFVMIDKERQLKNISNLKQSIKRKANTKKVNELISKSHSTLETIKWLIKEVINQKEENKISNEEFDELLFLLKRESKLFCYNALTIYLKNLIYIRKLVPKDLAYVIKIDENFEKAFLMINGTKYIATYNYSDTEHKKNIAMINMTNKFRNALEISHLPGPEFLDPVTKCIKIEKAIYDGYKPLESRNLYMKNVMVKTLIQEYILSNFFNNVYEYLSMDYFYYDNDKNIYTKEFGYNLNYLLEMRDCTFNDNIYASSNVFGYISVLLNKGDYSEYLNIMLELAHKIDGMDEQNFINIFEEYLDFLEQDKENIIQILLIRKRNFLQVVRNKINNISPNTDFSRKRI